SYVGTIGDCYAPQFHVVLRRHADFRVGFEAGVRLPELGARLREDGFVVFGRAQGGLMRGGPKIARRQIAQIDKSPPTIPSGILAPAGDGQIAPATITAT